MRKTKKVVYVGYTDDRPTLFEDESFYDGVRHLKVFVTKRAARKVFEDIRKFYLIPAKP